MKHTMAVFFQNSFNAIPRIAGLFSGKGYNIDSMSFGQGEEPGMTRMTLTVNGDDRIIEQINKQLNRLVDVTKVVDMTYEPFVERELALVKTFSTPATRSEIVQIANVFRAKIVDISPKTLTMEITGKGDKVDAAIGMLKPFGIREVARTGCIVLKREFQGQT